MHISRFNTPVTMRTNQPYFGDDNTQDSSTAPDTGSAGNSNDPAEKVHGRGEPNGNIGPQQVEFSGNYFYQL